MTGPVPWRVATSRCGAYDTAGFGGTPSQCTAAVTHAGLRLGQQPVQVWLSFSCHRHRGELIGARELLDRDRAVLTDWRDRERGALDGNGWDPPRPLAIGAAAHDLLRRAQPQDTPPSDS